MATDDGAAAQNLGNPVSPDDITADWLSQVLQENGFAGARVGSLQRKRIGTGQIGQCIRFTYDLETGPSDAPRSLVGKFASDDPTSRQTGVQLRNYLKEVRFYQELQSQVQIGTPRCYHASIDGEGPDFALILEDLAPGEPGNQLLGCNAAVAKAAVLELVGLHAPSWNDESLRGNEWLGEPTPQTVAIGPALYGAQLPGFIERYGPHLEADERDIIERVASSKGPPFELLGDVFSLVHVDYRLDNVMIDTNTSPIRVTTVDWQSITLGHPLSDVAYFLGAGLLPEVRRTEEEGIVRAYHESLVATGVTDYPWDQAWNDYRRGVYAGFAVTVIASMMVQETERGNEMFIAMAKRHSRHAIDLGSGEFL